MGTSDEWLTRYRIDHELDEHVEGVVLTQLRAINAARGLPLHSLSELAPADRDSTQALSNPVRNRHVV